MCVVLSLSLFPPVHPWCDAFAATLLASIYCGLVALFHELTRRQPRSPTCSSKRQRTETLPGCRASVKAKGSRRVDVYTQGKQESDS